MIHTDTNQNDLNDNLTNGLNVLNLRVDELEGQPKLSRNNTMGSLTNGDVVSYIGSSIFLELRRGLPEIDYTNQGTMDASNGVVPWYDSAADEWAYADSPNGTVGDVLTLDASKEPVWATNSALQDGTGAYQFTYWDGSAWALSAVRAGGEYTVEITAAGNPQWIKPRIKNSTVDGRMNYWDETTLGQWVETNSPSADQVMTFDGTPKWADPAGVVPDPTAQNQILIADADPKWANLTAPSTDDYVLRYNTAGGVGWRAGLPNAAVNGDIARHDGTKWAKLAVTEEEMLYDSVTYTFLATAVA